MRAKLIAGGALLALFVAFAFYFDHVRDKAAKYDEARAALASERQLFADYKAGIEADRIARETAERGYTDELTKLRDAVNARPVPVVRVCPPAGANPVLPAAESATTSTGGAAAAAGLLPSAAAADSGGSRDIGPALDRLLGRADELSAQLRGAIAYLEQ